MFINFSKYFGVLVLVVFSFYYTDRAVDIIKRNDPIMKSILSEKEEYEVESVNAQIQDDTIIPRLIRLTEAPSHGKPIVAYDPKSKGTEAYLNLAKEVIERNGHN